MGFTEIEGNARIYFLALKKWIRNREGAKMFFPMCSFQTSYAFYLCYFQNEASKLYILILAVMVMKKEKT